MTLIDYAVVSLVMLGCAFAMLAAIGVVRMPDLYTRMQSATKAGTLGVACVVAAAALHFGTASIAVEAVIILLFLFGTAPIASHLVARAAYVVGVPLWSQTGRDDLGKAMGGHRLTLPPDLADGDPDPR